MKYYIALGSNRGNRLRYLEQGMLLLNKIGNVQNSSKVYQSRAQGFTEQASFLNQVCILNSPLRPYRLLRKLKTFETELGRQLSQRWGPREIDLDIVDWEGPEISGSILEIPHPLMQQRAFVLQPLLDMAPKYRTRTGQTIDELLNRIDPVEAVEVFNETIHPQ